MRSPDVSDMAVAGTLPADPSDGTEYVNGTGPTPPNGHRHPDDDDSWRHELITRETKQGDVIVANLSNVVTVLRQHPRWAGVLWWDAFGERIVTRCEPPWHYSVQPSTRWYEASHELRDTDVARIIDWFAREPRLNLGIGAKLVEQAVPVVAEANAFHPVREYLEGLEWDEVERLPTWLATYCGVEQSEYAAAVGTRWMISAVARVMDPGCQVDCMLILEGDQGIYKSKLFRSLVPNPSLYSETGITIGDKDSYQALHGVWIYLFDELDSLKRGEVTRTKNFLTAQKDHYRPSYGRVARDFPRQNVFAGTTNDRTYLIDRTGNRRFWPVRVPRPIDIDPVVRDRDQLWAEALVRFQSGERWYVDTPELRALCEEEQAERVQPDDWEYLIAKWLAHPTELSIDSQGRTTRDPFDASQGVLTSEILVHALGFKTERIEKRDTMRVADALRALGWEPGPQRRESGVRVRRYVKGGSDGHDASQ